MNNSEAELIGLAVEHLRQARWHLRQGIGFSGEPSAYVGIEPRLGEVLAMLEDAAESRKGGSDAATSP